MTLAKPAVAVAAAAALGMAALNAPALADDDHPKAGIKHILLISVDGMHEVDLQNYLKTHPKSAFARLTGHGVSYTNASTSRPSDSFPGLMAFFTGGSPKSHGIFYDDSYDHTLYPPFSVSGAHCTGPAGTEVSNFEFLDWDLTMLDGGTGPGADPRNPHINPANLVQRLVNGKCELVYPHSYIKINTVMEVIHKAGLRTAWSDKHPAYEILNGPSGVGLDELYAPEINSTTVWQFTNLLEAGCPTPDMTVDWTAVPCYTRVYDNFKVAVVLKWIHGFDQTGQNKVGVPAIFGMNFQAVSVGQKVTADGYLDAAGTPSPELEKSLDFVDGSLGSFLAALDEEGLTGSTLVIVGAKHGQSPIDVNKLHMIFSSSHPNPKATLDVTDPIDLLTSGGVNVAQETADDISLLWLADHSQTASALAILDADEDNANHTRIQHIYAGAQLKRLFGDPGLGRTPDIIIQPIPGTIYSGSAAKVSEHGGFSADDTHVLLVVSNPDLESATVAERVQNKQVAPTILKALGLAPSALQGVQMEGTRMLPGLDFDH